MDLNISYDEIKSIGDQITTKGGEFQDLLNKIVSVNDELKSYWQGSDASRYTEKVEEQAVAMRKLAETINEIGAFLVKVGKAYQEVAENNTLN